MSHRVLLVDDHPLIREGYASLIRSERGLEVAGEASSAEEAFDLATRVEFAVAVVDLTLPGVNGIEFIKRLRSLHPDARILVVSGHEETLYAERCLRAGARGYLMKREAKHAFIPALRTVLAGETYLGRDLRERAAAADGGDDRVPLSDRLTDREIEVFEHFGRGRSTREVAEVMGLSLKTIESHRANIRQKLGLGGSAEFVRRAVLWVEDPMGPN
ncbi:response regulator transcription factor [Rubrivirga sp. IMCC45206]|uniref:response regulator transcription factor n=1 Tax=Rubrivirga sp. IMCC45206 TaxID=3391614 RepID=UPI00398F9BD8